MKKITMVVAGLLMLAGCQNYDGLVPQEFDKIMSFKEVGEQPINLYTTGEDGKYDLTVFKGGHKPSTTSSAEISAMSAAELEQYSVLTGKSYVALPANSYEINEPNISFDGSSSYANRTITLKTPVIQDIVSKNPGANYVVPLMLTSVTDSINTEKNIVIIKPSILVPVLSYENQSKTLNVASGETEYEFRLTLPFVSPWEFTADVAVDASAVSEPDMLIPESEYTIANGGKVTFKKGSTVSEPIKISLKGSSDVLVGNRNLLPLKVTSTTVEGIQAPAESFRLYATEYNRIPLTVDMLASNAQENVEGPIAHLIDNNPDTYFHSAYTYSVNAPHNISVDLKEKITIVSFKYQNRFNNNGKAQHIKVWAFDGEWMMLKEINSGLPVASGSIYSSQTFVAPRPFNKFLIEVMATNSGSSPTFFNMAEFYLYGK